MPLYFDFTAILAIATLLTLFIWIVDSVLFKPKRRQKLVAQQTNDIKEALKASEPKLVEYSKAFFPILLIVLLVRSFLAEPFRIPTGSMKPTLLEGDFILVNKFQYGIKMPLFGTKMIEMKEPKRGDIIVFRFPNNTKIDFIKRVIAVPGDKISYKNKTVFLNGQPLSQEYIGQTYDKDITGINHYVKHYKEKVNSIEHSIFVHPGNGKTHNEITVPEGHYFVMGDNRDNSEDSREWGFVPENLILGKAFFVWMSWDPMSKDIRWKRLGTSIN